MISFSISSLIILLNSIECDSTFTRYIDKMTSISSIMRRRDGKRLDLVMSDEFQEDGRHFEKGKDKFFESITKPDMTNQAMQFCKFFVIFILILIR